MTSICGSATRFREGLMLRADHSATDHSPDRNASISSLGTTLRRRQTKEFSVDPPSGTNGGIPC
jgi:hypothetical protein